MKRHLLHAYDLMMSRLNCCGCGVGIGCAVVVIAPVTGLIGTGTWLVMT